ncbi:uncharacterized protein K444DRAFT_611193 [Hyaloscypha bicolor E]|uniref:Uncharacterized protein n=1 Tax=Hyaloscypha bicolor E TaxID=1095630 RepID=A0A2J6TG94_9HELO|nr:uncharacterized protein K444DRAFT_611193 [Hyaloscypha bicolor E]PMD61978.1 hypothetical protein K444DRAFT_611193 [Hyaloscypha bicolor E]
MRVQTVPLLTTVSPRGGTCSAPVRGVPYEPAAHALRPWYYTASRGQRRVCEAEIERVVAGGGPSGVLLGGKGARGR